MKRKSTTNFTVLKLTVFSGLFAGCFFMSNIAVGQTYYSRFADTTGKLTVMNAGGEGCDAPPVENATAIVDFDENNYASFKGNTSTPYTCDSKYVFTTYLNLPPDSAALSARNQAGWRIKIPSSINPDSLGKYITVSTMLDSMVQESRTGALLSGLDAGQSRVNWILYFVTSKPFNMMQMTVDPKLFQLDKDFEFDVFYALSANAVVLPAKIENFTAAVAGKNVNLSWHSLTETNVSGYRLERSSNGGATYATVANLQAKGASTAAASYGYTDNVSVDGNYLYRLVMLNKDGSFNATNAISAVISGQGRLFLYPSIVTAGQTITVKTSLSGLTSVFVYDAEGRLVKQQRTNSAGQFSLATNGLSAGVYNIKVVSAAGTVLQSKIVIN